MGKRRSDYIYAGFRDSIQKITGDAYREICGSGFTKDQGESLRWDINDDELLIDMDPKDTYESLAVLCGVTAATVRCRYHVLEKQGLVPVRPRTRPDAYTDRENAMIRQCVELGLPRVAKMLPHRTEGAVRARAHYMGYAYDSGTGQWLYRGKVAA